MALEKVKERITRHIVGTESGEILETTVMYEGPDLTRHQLGNIKQIKDGDYMLAIQLKMGDVAKDREFCGNDLRVYLLLLSKLNWDGWLTINQSQLSRESGIARSEISRAMKILGEKDIIIRSEKKGTLPTYQLNARYGYKGSPKKMEAVQKQQQKRRLTIVA